MGWSIDFLQPFEPLRIRRYLGQVGRALYLAAMYEEKCMFLLRTALFVERGGKILHGSAAEELEARVKKYRLNSAIDKFSAIAGLDPNVQKNVLHDAREARNWIAHQSACIGRLAWVRREDIVTRTNELRKRIDDLVRGDVLVSLWMEEMETGSDWTPSDLRWLFPRWARNWVMRATLPVKGRRDPNVRRPTLSEIIAAAREERTKES